MCFFGGSTPAPTPVQDIRRAPPPPLSDNRQLAPGDQPDGDALSVGGRRRGTKALQIPLVSVQTPASQSNPLAISGARRS